MELLFPSDIYINQEYLTKHICILRNTENIYRQCAAVGHGFHLADSVDILPENINIPDGKVSPENLYQYCIDYEMKIKAVGGLDFQLLGIGRTGHIGFNEPGSHLNSRTRSITLDHITRVDAAPAFLGIDSVPRKAITMGIGTVLSAKRIILLAWGANKSEVLKETIEGDS